MKTISLFLTLMIFSQSFAKDISISYQPSSRFQRTYDDFGEKFVEAYYKAYCQANYGGVPAGIDYVSKLWLTCKNVKNEKSHGILPELKREAIDEIALEDTKSLYMDAMLCSTPDRRADSIKTAERELNGCQPDYGSKFQQIIDGLRELPKIKSHSSSTEKNKVIDALIINSALMKKCQAKIENLRNVCAESLRGNYLAMLMKKETCEKHDLSKSCHDKLSNIEMMNFRHEYVGVQYIQSVSSALKACDSEVSKCHREGKKKMDKVSREEQSRSAKENQEKDESYERFMRSMKR